MTMKETPNKVRTLTKRKKQIKKDVIHPIIREYSPLISILLFVLLIILVAVAPDPILLDLIVILKGIIQLLTLATM